MGRWDQIRSLRAAAAILGTSLSAERTVGRRRRALHPSAPNSRPVSSPPRAGSCGRIPASGRSPPGTAGWMFPVLVLPRRFPSHGTSSEAEGQTWLCPDKYCCIPLAGDRTTDNIVLDFAGFDITFVAPGTSLSTLNDSDV